MPKNILIQELNDCCPGDLPDRLGVLAHHRRGRSDPGIRRYSNCRGGGVDGGRHVDGSGREHISESGQSDCEQAGIRREQAALPLMIKGREMRCTRMDADPRRAGFQRTDRYGRPVARCEAGGLVPRPELIRRDHAMRWPRNPA